MTSVLNPSHSQYGGDTHKHGSKINLITCKILYRAFYFHFPPLFSEMQIVFFLFLLGSKNIL